MITVVTEHSTYEIDQEQRVIRRVSGVNPPTSRFAPDGEWKPYEALDKWMVDDAIFVTWPTKHSKYTLLSPTQEITDGELNLPDVAPTTES